CIVENLNTVKHSFSAATPSSAALTEAHTHLRRLVPKLAGKSMLLIGAEGDTIVPLDQHHEPLVVQRGMSRHGASDCTAVLRCAPPAPARSGSSPALQSP
ncbi:MAG: hypothetical protein ACREV1_03110, partial [Gammaproteobacteria bacterium]